MKINRILLFIMLITPLITSCGDDDDDEGNNPSTSVTLGDIAEGNGRIVTTGDKSVTIDGVMTLSTTGSASFSGNDFYTANYALVSDPNGAFVQVYWPQADGEVMPSGNYAIALDNADPNNPPSGRFVSLSVVVDGTSYSTWTGTTGSAEISNTNANYELDMSFTANGLEEFFDDLELNASGALKYRK